MDTLGADRDCFSLLHDFVILSRNSRTILQSERRGEEKVKIFAILPSKYWRCFYCYFQSKSNLDGETLEISYQVKIEAVHPEATPKKIIV
jgi:hypothetical protein